VTCPTNIIQGAKAPQNEARAPRWYRTRRCKRASCDKCNKNHARDHLIEDLEVRI